MRLSYYKYNLGQGLVKARTRAALVLSAIGLVMGGGGGLSLAILGSAYADSVSTTFEPSTYVVDSIDGQNGWSKTGAYDAAVVANTYGYASFGTQSLRISNSVTSGSFGDQTFSAPLSEQAGEANALDKNGNVIVLPKSHFEAQFDIASTTKAMQSGMALSVSPDNGSGARMSYLRFVDQVDGVHVYFDDVTDPSHAQNADNFNETDIATLSYAVPHTVKFSMDFVNGPDNDVVKIYIDGNLAKMGTSWEDYYLFDTESNPDLAQHNSRTVNSLLFREGGTAVPGNAGKGYLIDNLSLASGATSQTLPTSKDQCMNNGWKNYGNVFKNQGDCVSYVATKGKNQPTGSPTVAAKLANGNVTLSGPAQTLSFAVSDTGPTATDTGTLTYSNPGAGLTYTASITCANVFGNTAYFAYVIPAGNPYTGTWVVWKVIDNGLTDTAGFTTAADQNSARAVCEAGDSAVTNYAIVSGDITVL